MPFKSILLLANSRKHGERCIAGKEYDGQAFGAWIRPVSARATRGLDVLERSYRPIAEPELLDCLSMGVHSAVPRGSQSENWLLDKKYYWVKSRAASWQEAAAAVDAPGTLWTNGHRSSDGLNNEIPEAQFANTNNSLLLIRVPEVTVSAFTGYNNSRKLYAAFTYNGVGYRLSLTDTVMEEKYKNGQTGQAYFGESLLTISLGEPFTQNSGITSQYKLVAGLIPRNPVLPQIS